MQKNKPYIDSIRKKHPTIKYDAVAYEAGAKKSFSDNYQTFVSSIETIDIAIRTISSIFSLCDMNIYKVSPKGIKSPAKVKNIDFEFPNETDSSVDFLRKLAVNLYSQGAGLVVTEEAKRGNIPGKMYNFYALDVARVEAISDGKKLISEFKYTAEDGTEILYPASKCIYINDSIDTSNLLYSLSRLKALNDVILMQGGIVAQTKDMLAGGAKTASIISSDAPISTRNMKIIKTEFDTFMQSATASSFFMNTPLNITKVGNTLTGKEMLELIVQINKMMLESFAIPPYLIGRFEAGANRNTEITYSLRIFFSMVLKPVLKNIEKQMTRFMREQMGLKNLGMEFSYADLDILKLSEEEQSAVVISQLKGGLISLNEARESVDYLPLEGDAASNIFMPAYLLGNFPVSYNNFDEDLARLAENGTAPTDTLPAGNAGGADNENVVTGSRGGMQSGV